ncbi:DnaA ATPase domain-containing protein [Ostreiculturibacter nitratireducens]|uniref:DnaA ATPase domain-containing protein n=1 Tax=Ostreiculturibacter nitratireducens TaxID=3075226 RepID=UPI0031B5A01A
MARQLAFDLPVRPALGRDDFLVAPSNALALKAIDADGDWPQGKLALVGPAGAGKTHLVHVWAAATGADVVRGIDLPDADIPAIAAAGRVAVEDADRIAGNPAAEAALFHLHNLVLAEGGRLLMTARTAPRRWGLTLPDLASRVEAASVAAIEAPDDALLAAVLVKLFADRQLTVAPTLVPYLVTRMERSFDAARKLVAALDAAALAQGRPVTRALAADVLDSASGGAQ